MPVNDINNCYVKNCILSPKKDEILFSVDGDEIHPHLDGYAIIACEEYKKLLQSDMGTKKTCSLSS